MSEEKKKEILNWILENTHLRGWMANHIELDEDAKFDKLVEIIKEDK